MAGKKSQHQTMHNPGLPFRIPEIVGRVFRPGRQPDNPGESQIDVDFGVAPMPWPRQVAPLNLFAHSPGIPQAPALGIDNNRTAPLPYNALYISGFTKKSRG